MLEEALDPRPVPSLDPGCWLTGSAATQAAAAEWLAHTWNDDTSFWTNVRTLEYWIDRAER
jgi:hypothetical protein